MNMKMIRRTCAAAVMMIGAMATMAAPSEAQPRALPQPISINGPADGATMAYDNAFSWKDTGANKYVLKFTVVETGAKFKLNATSSCQIYDCVVELEDTPVFDAVKDGQTISWRVIGKYTGSKVKSTPRTVIANTVTAPNVMNPPNGFNVYEEDVLEWYNWSVNDYYVLIVKHNATGKRVIKHSVQAEGCQLYCSIYPHGLANLSNGATYKWFVKAVGFNGNKQKSFKTTFEVPMLESSD